MAVVWHSLTFDLFLTTRTSASINLSTTSVQCLFNSIKFTWNTSWPTLKKVFYVSLLYRFMVLLLLLVTKCLTNHSASRGRPGSLGPIPTPALYVGTHKHRHRSKQGTQGKPASPHLKPSRGSFFWEKIYVTGWWLSHPSEKILVKLDHLPR